MELSDNFLYSNSFSSIPGIKPPVEVVPINGKGNGMITKNYIRSVPLLLFPDFCSCSCSSSFYNTR